MGTFEARNSRDIQAFAINDPLIWAKYLRVEFLSQYGNEFYCPVSLLRVHGTTMIEDYNRDMEGRHEDETEEESTVALQEGSPPEPGQSQQPGRAGAEDHEKGNSAELPSTQTDGLVPQDVPDSVDDSTAQTATEANGFNMSLSPGVVASTVDGVDDASIQSSGSGPRSSSQANSALDIGPEGGSAKDATTSDDKSSTQPAVYGLGVQPLRTQMKLPRPKHNRKLISSQHRSNKPPHQRRLRRRAFSNRSTNGSKCWRRTPPCLCSDIEEQSQILRDAFSKVEKRQLAKTEEFLQHLNDSVRAELKTFRAAVRSAVAVDRHRARNAPGAVPTGEILAVTSRLSIVADELVFQKRMAVVQSTLLLLCLGLVLFVRTGGSALDLPADAERPEQVAQHAGPAVRCVRP